MLHARRVGKNKWVAKCPAHQERTGSLYITPGKDGSAWAHCFGGCDQKAVLEALGLTWSDLKPEGRSMTPQAIREAERARQREESLRVATKHRKGKLIDQARYWEGEVDRIGKLLAKDFDSVKIAKQLHWAIERGRAAQEAIRPFFHPANVPGEQMTPTRRHAGEFKYFIPGLPACAGKFAGQRAIKIWENS